MTRKMMLRSESDDDNVTTFVTNWAATAALASNTAGTGISGYAASQTLIAGTDKIGRLVGSVAELIEGSVLGAKLEGPTSRTLSYGNFAVFMQVASWYIVWAAHWGPRFLEPPVSRARYMKWSREVMNLTMDVFDEKYWTTLYGNTYLADETKHRVRRAHEVNATKLQNLQGRLLAENRAGFLGEAFYQYYRSAFSKTTEERFGRTLHGNLLISMNEQALLDLCIDMIFDLSAFGVDSKSRIHNHMVRSYLAQVLGSAFGGLILPAGGTIKVTQDLRASHGNIPYGDEGELYSDADDTVPLRHWWEAFYPDKQSEEDHKAVDYSNLWDRMRFLNVLFRVYSNDPIVECPLFSREQFLNGFPSDADYCYRTSYSADRNCCARHGLYSEGGRRDGPGASTPDPRP